MKYREYYDNVLVRIEKGEDVVEKLFELVDKLQLKNGSISGIGASDNITVGLYSVEKQEY
ncbi:PCC domain-containing protein, partial [Finegoldia magna]|uniref:PCC domain-containing protein n=2 Tax=Peptoniphilaceae TaxID=1570339 RepID=UPI0026EFB029